MFTPCLIMAVTVTQLYQSYITTQRKRQQITQEAVSSVALIAIRYRHIVW